MMLFLTTCGFGKCSVIRFVDLTMIPVCHNLHRYSNKVFGDLATNGKGTMGWCHGFKNHFVCNDKGEILTFCLSGANTDDRDPAVWRGMVKRLFGQDFADRNYISLPFFEHLLNNGVHLVMGLRSNMKNRLMPMRNKILLRRCCIIETINDVLKNETNLIHSINRSLQNYIMKIVFYLTAYGFSDNKPQALQEIFIDKTELSTPMLF